MGPCWLEEISMDRKKGGCCLQENPVNGEKVECNLDKVKEAYPWEYCEEIMPGMHSDVTSHMRLSALKLKLIKIKQLN